MKLKLGTYFCPEGSQTGFFEHLPPSQELIERLLPGMDLKLELTEGQGFALLNVGFDQRGKCVEFPALNIDFENVDEFVF